MSAHRINFLKDLEPRSLSELAGYEEYVDLMHGWLRTESFPTSILLVGDIGVGKSIMATLLAKTAACLHRPTGSIQPCGKCVVCQAYDSTQVPQLVGSRIVEKQFGDEIRLARVNGPGRLWLWEHGRWYALIVDEFHELPKQSQREIRAELDYPWSDSFIIGTCSTTKGIDPALLNRMYPIYVQPPSKTPLIAWIESICRKTGIEVIDSKAAGLLADLTGGRFRAMKMCLQRIYDTSGGKLAEDDVRKACRACGYSPTEFASTRLHQRAEKRE